MSTETIIWWMVCSYIPIGIVVASVAKVLEWTDTSEGDATIAYVFAWPLVVLIATCVIFGYMCLWMVLRTASAITPLVQLLVKGVKR